MRHLIRAGRVSAAALVTILAGSVGTTAQPLAMTQPNAFPAPLFDLVLRQPTALPQPSYEAVPAEKSAAAVPAHLRRQVVAYDSRHAPGTIVIDTANTYLYYVVGQGRAIRYGIGVGREGFTWSGVQTVSRKQEWPDWHPPAEMIARQPYLPRYMAGGLGNPLGARAIYLGSSLYRVHGTNEPHSIGQRVSSGCIRMLNEDVIDLYERARIGAKVVVLPDTRRRAREAMARATPADTARARTTEPQPEPAHPARHATTPLGPSLQSGSFAAQLY
jgi:lipoprotein-anchoring transpeptidase ErfK/SrfK